jgi:hypothetical protein
VCEVGTAARLFAQKFDQAAQNCHQGFFFSHILLISCVRPLRSS